MICLVCCRVQVVTVATRPERRNSHGPMAAGRNSDRQLESGRWRLGRVGRRGSEGMGPNYILVVRGRRGGLLGLRRHPKQPAGPRKSGQRPGQEGGRIPTHGGLARRFRTLMPPALPLPPPSAAVVVEGGRGAKSPCCRHRRALKGPLQVGRRLCCCRRHLRFRRRRRRRRLPSRCHRCCGWRQQLQRARRARRQVLRVRVRREEGAVGVRRAGRMGRGRWGRWAAPAGEGSRAPTCTGVWERCGREGG
jgi:hypothetical protein